MFQDVIIEQNPHWSGEPYEHGIERSYLTKLLEYLATGMIISLMGVRRAGKSTLLKQMINHLMLNKNVPPKNILFLNLEHPYFAFFATEIGNLQRIYEEYLRLASPEGKVYIFLDEVQFFHEWPIFVKSHYEQKKVQFFLTGSNSSLLSVELMTLLSGRTLSLEIFPLSFTELVLANKIDVKDPVHLSKNRNKLNKLLDQMLEYGGFPEVALNLLPTVAYDILNSYAKTILYQDVAPRLQARKPLELERLFVYLISHVGKPFSYSNLSILFDLSDKAIKEYIGAFVESYLLFELEVFDYSLKKQIKNPKKIFSIDTGQINGIAFHFTENKGRLLENLVFLELRRIGFEMYYYKTENNLEIDFVAKKNLKLALIQVAWNLESHMTFEREKRALIRGLHELKLSSGIIITQNHEERLTEDDKTIVVVPAYKFFCLSSDKKIELLKL